MATEQFTAPKDFEQAIRLVLEEIAPKDRRNDDAPFVWVVFDATSDPNREPECVTYAGAEGVSYDLTNWHKHFLWPMLFTEAVKRGVNPVASMRATVVDYLSPRGRVVVRFETDSDMSYSPQRSVDRLGSDLIMRQGDKKTPAWRRGGEVPSSVMGVRLEGIRPVESGDLGVGDGHYRPFAEDLLPDNPVGGKGNHVTGITRTVELDGAWVFHTFDGTGNAPVRHTFVPKGPAGEWFHEVAMSMLKNPVSKDSAFAVFDLENDTYMYGAMDAKMSYMSAERMYAFTVLALRGDKASEYDRDLALGNVSLSPRIDASEGLGRDGLRVKKISDENPLFG